MTSDKHKTQTVELLLAAELHIEAYEYMPSLERARSEHDIDALLGHAGYLLARSQLASSEQERQQFQVQTWELYTEIVSFDDTPIEQRLTTLQAAIDLLPSVPPRSAEIWLDKLFTDPTLASATLEAITIQALKISDSSLSDTLKTQLILTIKTSVDTLLDSPNVDPNQIRIPLRMLTLSLVTQAESLMSGQFNSEQRVGANRLLKALPDAQWRAALEPSLAPRAYAAFISIAVASNDVDLALDLLEEGISEAPDQAEHLAGEFLRVWTLQLRPPANNTPRAFWHYLNRSASVPVTRGRKQRNIERLTRVLDLLDNIGINGSQLPGVVDAFTACHGRSESFERETLIEILGPIDHIGTEVKAEIARQMAAGLNGDWRSRDVQGDAGFNRSDSQLRSIIDDGYRLAFDLIDSALADAGSNSWQYAITAASLRYDHLEFRTNEDTDPAELQESKDELFKSISDATAVYRELVSTGEIPLTIDLYTTWFTLALGSSDLGSLTLESLIQNARGNKDQIDLIRNSLEQFDPVMRDAHMEAFADVIMAALSQIDSSVKTRVVHHTNRILGDHPAGSAIRQIMSFHEDIINNEVHLQLAVDGSERVGTEPFGATLSVQHTTSFGREVGGFDRYLRSQEYSYIFGRYTRIDYLARLQLSIEESLNESSFELIGLGFFPALNPSRNISVNGETGWEEKPLAYLILRAKDPSADHLPAIQMDLTLQDTTGSVVLPITSNTALIDATTRSPEAGKPHSLFIEQRLNPGQRIVGGKLNPDPEVTLEVTALGLGTVPDIEEIFPDLESAIPGYEIAEDGIAQEPIVINAGIGADIDEKIAESEDPTGSNRDQSNEPEIHYIDPDENGTFRLGAMRTWVVRFTPASDDVEATSFTFPDLASEYDGMIKRTAYEEYELVDVSGNIYSLDGSQASTGSTAARVMLQLLVAAVLGGGIWLYFWLRRPASPDAAASEYAAVAIPASITPTSTVTTLRHIARQHRRRLSTDQQSELTRDIDSIEQAYFGQGESQDKDKLDLQSMLKTWTSRAR